MGDRSCVADRPAVLALCCAHQLAIAPHLCRGVAQRVAGEDAEVTLRMRWRYAEALCWDTAATLDDVREAVTTLEETLPTARRVLGGAHPFTVEVERNLGDVRAALRDARGA